MPRPDRPSGATDLSMPFRSWSLTPAQALVASIGGLIAVGTILLALPWSASAARLSLVDALFTSTSAVCVTGLIVVDTPNDLSGFGQVVVMLLIQAGGLGYMTITTVVAMALGKRLSLRERLTLQEALNLQTGEGLLKFTLGVLRMTLLFELVGAAALALWWWPDMGAGRAAYFGVFHAISAFNNAGFALFSDSLMGYRGDILVNLVISTLLICGGLGFVVLTELMRFRRGARLSLHSRFVLVLTAALIVGGTATVYLLEFRNPATLGALPPGEAWMAAYFQSVTTRTAGFNTLNLADLHVATLFVIMVLMFIGASPGGTGGGVKTTTFGITVAALWATVRGDEETVLFGRRLAPVLVARAFFISLIAFLGLNVVAGLLLIREALPLMDVLFETTSAFGTVGLSIGAKGAPLSLSGQFSDVSKILVVLMIFAGRVGPLTLAVALAQRRQKPRVRYPEGTILIG
jgi:trk system potassium uptake protein TrkH